jgi:hypothetical protein
MPRSSIRLASCDARALLLIAGLAGCGGSTTSSDAGPDASDAPAAIDANGDAQGDPAVASCQDAVDALIAVCDGTADPPPRRLCVQRAYRDACLTGRPEVIEAIAHCLVTEACETARDPLMDAACVADAVAMASTPTHAMLDQAWCTCTPSETGCPSSPMLTGAENIMLAEADAQRVIDCLSGCATPAYCLGITPLGAAIHQCAMLMP